MSFFLLPSLLWFCFFSFLHIFQSVKRYIHCSQSFFVSSSTRLSTGITCSFQSYDSTILSVGRLCARSRSSTFTDNEYVPFIFMTYNFSRPKQKKNNIHLFLDDSIFLEHIILNMFFN